MCGKGTIKFLLKILNEIAQVMQKTSMPYPLLILGWTHITLYK